VVCPNEGNQVFLYEDPTPADLGSGDKPIVCPLCYRDRMKLQQCGGFLQGEGSHDAGPSGLSGPGSGRFASRFGVPGRMACSRTANGSPPSTRSMVLSAGPYWVRKHWTILA